MLPIIFFAQVYPNALNGYCLIQPRIGLGKYFLLGGPANLKIKHFIHVLEIKHCFENY